MRNRKGTLRQNAVSVLLSVILFAGAALGGMTSITVSAQGNSAAKNVTGIDAIGGNEEESDTVSGNMIVSPESNSSISGNENTGNHSDNTSAGRSKDHEPKTGDTTPLDFFVILVRILGLVYLIVYLSDYRHNMTEEKKEALVSKLIAWARKGSKIRRLPALTAVFMLLVYYHSFGKKTAIEWNEGYGE